MRFFLAADGTRGDVQPLIALATALQAGGHEVTLAATPGFAGEVERFGVAFVPFGRNGEELLREQAAIIGRPLKLIRVMRDMVCEGIRAQFGVLRSHARDADLIACAGVFCAGSSVAKAQRSAYRYVAYTPQFLPSSFHPPIFVPAQNLPRLLNRICWRLTAMLWNAMARPVINEERQTFGLPPLNDAFADLTRADRVVLAADPEIAPLPPDLEGLCEPMTGSWQLSDDRTLDERTEAFLNAGDPPVYIGFGSMTDESPEETARAIVEAIDIVGCRAIVAAGWAKLCVGVSHPRILCIDAAPHARLFSRVGAIVHHGGAGTTSAASRAGVPQVIVPHLLDQFHWAHRVRELGIGPRPIKRLHLSASDLAARIREALTDPQLRRRAREVAAAACARDALPTAIAALERAASQRALQSVVPPRLLP